MDAIKIFCSMTDEPNLKKYLAALRKSCDRIGRLLDVRLEVIHWREMAAGLGDTAQDVIDKQAAAQNIYFGLMGTSFGVGTEHEYRKAVKGFVTDGSPAYVSFGFCEEKVNPYGLDIPSFTKLKKFRQDVAKKGKYGRALLYFTFASMEEFEKAIERNLKTGIGLVRGGVVGGPRFKTKSRSRP
jgi:hypothetical protein